MLRVVESAHLITVKGVVNAGNTGIGPLPLLPGPPAVVIVEAGVEAGVVAGVAAGVATGVGAGVAAEARV